MSCFRIKLWLFLLVFFLLAGGGVALAEDLNQRVEKLEQQVQALGDQQTSLADEFLRRTYIGAYANFRYVDAQGENNHFDGNRLHLVLNSMFHDRIRAYVDINFQRAAGVAADNWQTQTISTNNRSGIVSVFESYADFMLAKWLNLRAGIFLVPLTEYNRNPYMVNKNFADDPMQDVWEYSDVGAEFFGSVNLTDNVSFNYELGGVQGLRSQPEGIFPTYDADNNKAKSLFGRTYVVFYDQYLFNVAGYYGDYSVDDKESFAITGYFKATPNTKILEHFELLAEFGYLHWENRGAVFLTTDFDNTYAINTYLVYKFWPSFLDKTFLGKSFDDPKFTLGFRYVRLRTKFQNALINNINLNNYAMAFGYRPVSNFVMHLQYSIGDGNTGMNILDNNTFMVNVAYSF
ncbi:MAG: hypothetical protein KKE11_02340 [Gammaproteobacteria bacterium]|nr:hypothetical protein [Gammaproteobacteria bacterium]